MVKPIIINLRHITVRQSIIGKGLTIPQNATPQDIIKLCEQADKLHWLDNVILKS